ncbi:MAG: hypothetical protein LBO09_09425 [Candidatus Peribacteria bacterium]|nr:hypothetical protein [Candidatus Peribacteria bacterium]
MWALPPIATVFYTPSSGTMTSGNVLATLIANKPLLPLTGRTDLGS